MPYNPAQLRNDQGEWTTGGSSSSSIEQRVFGSYSGPLRSEVIPIVRDAHPLLVSGNLGLVFHKKPKDYRPDAPDEAIAAYDPSEDRVHVFASAISGVDYLQRHITVYHELFHRLDFDSGKREFTNLKHSSNIEFQGALAQDIKAMSAGDKRLVSHLSTPVEAYAEIAARMGLPSEPDNRVLQVFPRSRKWMEKHLLDLGFK